MTTDQKKKLAELQTELTRLYTLGVFHLVPSVRNRFDGNGEEFIFNKLGRVICNPNVKYKRTVAIPKLNLEKRKLVFEKFERTKRAEELVKQINELTKHKQKQAQIRTKASILLETAANLRAQADKLEREAAELQAIT